MSDIIETAKRLAKKAHKDQKYFTTDKVMPFVWHLEKTAVLAKRLGYDKDVIATCWLHDIVEDTNVTLDDLRLYFPEHIVSAVDAVTFDKTKGKIAKAKKDPIGHVVKFCDATINYAATAIYGPVTRYSQWEITVDRYLHFLEELHKGLPKPDQITKYITDKK